MNRISLIVLTGVLSVGLLLTGCFVDTGSTRKTHYPKTFGRELIDLKKARDKRAIGEDDYQELRAKLIQSYRNADGDSAVH